MVPFSFFFSFRICDAVVGSLTFSKFFSFLAFLIIAIDSYNESQVASRIIFLFFDADVIIKREKTVHYKIVLQSFGSPFEVRRRRSR